MNALLEHTWGKSAAQDRVWAQVACMNANRAVRRLFMVLQFQAFMDESESSHSDIEFVLGGYIQTAAVWANFVLDWEKLLPLGIKDKHGNLQFHMTEMKFAGKMKEVEQFSNIIDKHNLYPVSFRMNLESFRSAITVVERRFQLQGINDIDWERAGAIPIISAFAISFTDFIRNEKPLNRRFPSLKKSTSISIGEVKEL